jgi:hypothetical protein
VKETTMKQCCICGKSKGENDSPIKHCKDCGRPVCDFCDHLGVCCELDDDEELPMPYTDQQYLDADMYEDGDADIRAYKKKIVTTRKVQQCATGQHAIQPHSRAVQESALVEGEWGTAHTCLPCIDKWLDSISEG